MCRLGLPNIFRRIVALIIVTWVPLLLLSLKDGLAFGHKVHLPFLYDFSIYGRFLLGLPLLVIAEVVIDPTIKRTVQEFVNAGMVPSSEMPAFDRVLSRVRRLRDAAAPEIALLVFAFFPVFLFQHEWAGGAISSWHNFAGNLTSAGWWYAAISTPVLRFIIYRWAYRYAIWCVLLWRIGRLKLELMPTHPDRSAGLDFLSLAQRRFGILFCALGCFFAGRVADAMLFEGASFASFKFLIVGYLVLSVLVGLLPLVMLAPKLRKVRRNGLLEYGRLANQYTQDFDRKWVHAVHLPTEPLLGSSDIQSLADLGNSYSIVHDMTIAPITRKLTIQIAAQAGLPLLPILILGTPTGELVNAVLKMIL